MTKRPLLAMAVAMALVALGGCGGTYPDGLSGSYNTSFKRGSEALRAKAWDRAAEHYEFAASSGHPKALIAYGRLFAKGQGVEQDPIRASQLFEEAYEKPSSSKDRAALELGLLLIKGGEGPSGTLEPDAKRAKVLLLEALEGGQQRAASSLARIYEDGLGVEPDINEAISYYVQAPANDAFASRNLARLLAREGGAEDDIARATERAVDAFEARAKNGDGSAWVQLAEIYSRNEITEADPERARSYLLNLDDPDDTAMQMRLARIYGRIGERQERNRLMRLAADAGDVRAQTQLAKLFLRPRTADTNGAVGRYYAERAIGQGSQPAMVTLGLAMLRGDVLEPDTALGETLLRRASTDGHLGATTALGGSILNGDVVARSPDEGQELLEAAAEQGSSDAMRVLGLAYLKGRGLLQDETLAMEWLKKAASAGNSRAQAFLADRSGA